MDKDKEMLEEEIKSLKEQLKVTERKLQKYKDKENKDKYYLNADGMVKNFDKFEDFYKNVAMQNNTFKTVDEAIKERERRELLHEFYQFRDECNGSWEPDFNEWSEQKYFININHKKELSWDIVISLNSLNLFGYFVNQKHCQLAIDKFGDRIKKLFVD